MLLAIYYDKLYCKANGLLAFLQVELLKIGYFVRYFSNSFQPVGFDVISPLNLLYGKMNQNLPTRAYWYNVSDATDICAEYTFRYTLTGDYITGMTIEEKINPVNGATAENNTYEYEFIYNFVVEQK